MESHQADIDSLRASYKPWIEKRKVTSLEGLKKRIAEIREKDPDCIHYGFENFRSGSMILNDIVKDAELIQTILDECGNVDF